jgi:predicted hydrocarbon binding protein
MHGAIFAELQDFVAATHGAEFWRRMVETAGIPARLYIAVGTYPDEEALALVAAASALSGKSIRSVLTAFGRHLAPRLLEMFGHLVQENWRTLDVLEHSESSIHRVVRLRDAAAKPPALQCTRVDDGEVAIAYGSPRRLCALAIGLAEGFAEAFSETIEVKETECVERGASRCLIRCRRVSSAAPGIIDPLPGP